MKKTFKQFLIEAPITNYDTVGDFSRGLSFTDRRDRILITNPKTIELTKKKFANTEHTINFIFVNTKEGRKFTEVGIVDGLDWVRNNLGKEVAAKLENIDLADSINVIFTNNKGAEKIPLTGWMMAHRLAHAMARKNGTRPRYSQYKEASNSLISTFSSIMDLYGVANVPTDDDRMSWANFSTDYKRVRKNQLMMKHFFQQVATFRSARKGIIRDWFEVLNELVAQYLTTGKVKFNKAPTNFISYEPNGQKTYLRINSKQDLEEANEMLDTLSRTMEYMIDDIMSTMYGEILVM